MCACVCVREREKERGGEFMIDFALIKLFLCCLFVKTKILFFHQVAVLAQLKHPNIITYVESFEGMYPSFVVF